jgi:hypothetical protein
VASRFEHLAELGEFPRLFLRVDDLGTERTAAEQPERARGQLLPMAPRELGRSFSHRPM